jgi:hypothetical protein
LAAERALSGTGEAAITYTRHDPEVAAVSDLRTYLRIQRPFGLLPADATNPRLLSVRGFKRLAEDL